MQLISLPFLMLATVVGLVTAQNSPSSVDVHVSPFWKGYVSSAMNQYYRTVNQMASAYYAEAANIRLELVAQVLYNVYTNSTSSPEEHRDLFNADFRRRFLQTAVADMGALMPCMNHVVYRNYRLVDKENMGEVSNDMRNQHCLPHPINVVYSYDRVGRAQFAKFQMCSFANRKLEMYEPWGFDNWGYQGFAKEQKVKNMFKLEFTQPPHENFQCNSTLAPETGRTWYSTMNKGRITGPTAPVSAAPIHILDSTECPVHGENYAADHKDIIAKVDKKIQEWNNNYGKVDLGTYCNVIKNTKEPLDAEVILFPVSAKNKPRMVQGDSHCP